MSSVDPFPLSGVIVDPGNDTATVTITTPGGANATVFSDAFGVQTVSLPATITSPTTFYIGAEGPWVVNGQTVTLDDSQVATVTLYGPPPPSRKGTRRPASIPYYNVKDYGAVGDGVTDDTAAINAAFTAAARSVGWVVIPAGTFLTSNTVGPTTTVNGLRIVGAGVGETTLSSNQTGGGAARKILGNNGNDTGWVVEGITFNGAGASLTSTVTLGAGGVFTYGTSVTGFFAVFLNDSEIRACEFKNCNTGVIDYNGNFNNWYVHSFSNRNVGIALLETTGTNVNGLYQVQGGTAGSTEIVANVFLGNITNGHGGPAGAYIISPVIDELVLNKTHGGASLHVAAATDCIINAQKIWAPGKKQAGGAAYYGARIGPLSTRTEIRGSRVEPFTVDTTRVPDNTILIESGATGTMLSDISTNPNAANGGGDLSDLGTGTQYRNVSLNGGPIISSIATKAGVPSDADYQVAPPVGTQVLDTTDSKIYYRTASATWKGVTIA